MPDSDSATVPPADRAGTPASGRSLQATRCPVCGGARMHYAFSIQGARVLQCDECRFTARSGPPPHRVTDGRAAAAALEARAGSLDAALAPLLEGAGDAAPRLVAWRPDGTVDLESGRGAAISVGQLDAFVDPMASLESLRRLVAPGDPVLFVYSDVRCSGVEPGTTAWNRLIAERHAYLDTHTALTVLHRAGFRCRGLRRLRRRVTVAEVLDDTQGAFVCRGWRRRMLSLLPRALRRAIHIDARLSDVAILATPRPTAEPLVSVVVPVFNEAATVARVLDAVLAVRFEGAGLEVIVVESNSSDGSREIVQAYADRPGVTCLFEDRPRGKGHATRLGLAHARGDVILIQDADLEYDIEDYHALVQPILRGHEAFVLGSRHGGRSHWKLRQFGKPLLSKFYNVAHVLVTAYINLLFGLSLRDPQTMYKVCRRDCIEGLSFHGNYFDFDYEFLLKIARRGYEPVEVPVNYRSRSHAEGKKLTMRRDAPLGLLMITRLRLIRLRSFLHLGDPIE